MFRTMVSYELNNEYNTTYPAETVSTGGSYNNLAK